MNRLIYITLFFSRLLSGCSHEKPNSTDFIGLWKGSDSAVIIIKYDGTFIGKHLPFQIFFEHPTKDTLPKQFDGSGKWSYKREENFSKKQHFELNLEFKNISYTGYSGLNTQIMVRGENGFWDNKPPWYLFLWVSEEGGDTYNFYKQ